MVGALRRAGMEFWRGQFEGQKSRAKRVLLSTAFG